MKITTEDILSAIELPATVERPAGAFTAKEIAKAKGVSLSTVMRWLHTVEAAGRLEVFKIPGMRLNGWGYPLTAYRIKKK